MFGVVVKPTIVMAIVIILFGLFMFLMLLMFFVWPMVMTFGIAALDTPVTVHRTA